MGYLMKKVPRILFCFFFLPFHCSTYKRWRDESDFSAVFQYHLHSDKSWKLVSILL